jgi:hypothetical protein
MRSCSKCGDNEYKKCGNWSSCKPYTPGTWNFFNIFGIIIK